MKEDFTAIDYSYWNYNNNCYGFVRTALSGELVDLFTCSDEVKLGKPTKTIKMGEEDRDEAIEEMNEYFLQAEAGYYILHCFNQEGISEHMMIYHPEEGIYDQDWANGAVRMEYDLEKVIEESYDRFWEHRYEIHKIKKKDIQKNILNFINSLNN